MLVSAVLFFQEQRVTAKSEEPNSLLVLCCSDAQSKLKIRWLGDCVLDELAAWFGEQRRARSLKSVTMCASSCPLFPDLDADCCSAHWWEFYSH